jgi:hypothetical protein
MGKTSKTNEQATDRDGSCANDDETNKVSARNAKVRTNDEEQETDGAALSSDGDMKIAQDLEQGDTSCQVDGCGIMAVAIRSDKEDEQSGQCHLSQVDGGPDGIFNVPLLERREEGKDQQPVQYQVEAPKDEEGQKVQGEVELPVHLVTPSSRKVAAPADIEPFLDHNLAGNSSESNEKEGDDEEVWDLKKIMSIQAVSSNAPIKCSTDDCLMPAACAWVSTRNPTVNWYTCLDCQVGRTTCSLIARHHQPINSHYSYGSSCA